jgi:hypothetical protein
MTELPQGRPKQSSPLLYFLAAIMLIFIGILIFVYAVTKRTHPIYLDEHGRGVNAAPERERHRQRSGKTGQSTNGSLAPSP